MQKQANKFISLSKQMRTLYSCTIPITKTKKKYTKKIIGFTKGGKHFQQKTSCIYVHKRNL